MLDSNPCHNVFWGQLQWLDFEGLSIGNLDDFTNEINWLQDGLHTPTMESEDVLFGSVNHSRAWARRDRRWFVKWVVPDIDRESAHRLGPSRSVKVPPKAHNRRTRNNHNKYTHPSTSTYTPTPCTTDRTQTPEPQGVQPRIAQSGGRQALHQESHLLSALGTSHLGWYAHAQGSAPRASHAKHTATGNRP